MPQEMNYYDLESFANAVRANTTRALKAMPPIWTPPDAEKAKAYMIRIEWLLNSIKKLTDDGEKYMLFIVENRGVSGNPGEIIPAAQYKLYAVGTDDKGERMVAAEDFPPHVWP
jgi:hypothetical protein